MTTRTRPLPARILEVALVAFLASATLIAAATGATAAEPHPWGCDVDPTPSYCAGPSDHDLPVDLADLEGAVRFACLDDVERPTIGVVWSMTNNGPTPAIFDYYVDGVGLFAQEVPAGETVERTGDYHHADPYGRVQAYGVVLAEETDDLEACLSDDGPPMDYDLEEISLPTGTVETEVAHVAATTARIAQDGAGELPRTGTPTALVALLGALMAAGGVTILRSIQR